MVKYTDIMLSEIMPQNLLEDKTVADCCKAIDTELTKVSKLCSEVLLISRIDELSEDVIDLLAWQWHVDFYDKSLDIEVKRNLLRKSIDWHRHKGTLYAVKEVVAAVFDKAEIQEYWQYGGQPYHFKIASIESGIPAGDELNKLIKCINSVKNVRSWLDDVDFGRKAEGTIYYGGFSGIYKNIEVGLPMAKDADIDDNIYFAGVAQCHKTVIAELPHVTDNAHDGNIYCAGNVSVYKQIIN